MSLLSSIIQAGTRFQQNLDRRTTSPELQPGDTGRTPASQLKETGTDDRFTPSGDSLTDTGRRSLQKLPLADYKQTVGQDLAYIRETLRHKLAEYSQSPSTAVSVSKSDNGRIEVNGKLADDARSRIENDLNVNNDFTESFRRLSVNEPTLHFMDNALKLNQAYGVTNSLLDTLVSDNQQFKGLQDLVHRYDSLRRSTPTATVEAAAHRNTYAFNLNTRA